MSYFGSISVTNVYVINDVDRPPVRPLRKESLVSRVI